MFRRSAFVIVGFFAVAALPIQAGAREYFPLPTTNHTVLTLSTDDTAGYQVLPGKPLKLEVMGPGDLNLTVRLTQKGKQPILQGALEILRDKKLVKRADLKLHRSQVGSFKEDKTLSPSLPKVFKIAVPAGRQTYFVNLKAARGVSISLTIAYETEADQSLARADAGSELELVPLVAPGTGEPELPLVPLEPPPPAKPPEKPAAKPAEPAVEKPVVAVTKPPEKPTPPSAGPTSVPPSGKTPEGPSPVKPEKTAPPENVASATSPPPAGGVRVVEVRAEQPPTLEKKTRARRPVASLGVKLGQISPLEKVGGTTFAGSLDVRYVLPVFEGRLSAGVAAGYHRYQLTLTNWDETRTSMVIPISLQMFYRLPLGFVLEPFVGLGADLFIIQAELDSAGDSPNRSASAIAFGGHLTAGVEARLGPGYALVELSAGWAKADIDGIWSNFNPAGFSTLAGYRFEF